MRDARSRCSPFSAMLDACLGLTTWDLCLSYLRIAGTALCSSWHCRLQLRLRLHKSCQPAAEARSRWAFASVAALAVRMPLSITRCRCVQGVCYHMFSRARSSAFAEFQVPELQRTPLEELCLQVSLLPALCSCCFHGAVDSGVHWCA